MSMSLTFTSDDPTAVSVSQLRLFGEPQHIVVLYTATGGVLTNLSFTFVFPNLADGTYFPLTTVTYSDGTTSDVTGSPFTYPPATGWSYTGSPLSSDKDAVRFLLGDTDPADPLITDAGINFLLLQWGDTYSAAAAGAEQVAGQFAREVAYSGDGVQVDFSQLQDKYMALAGQLRKLKARNGRLGIPFVGGMYKSETRQLLDNDNIELTLFSVGMHDDTREGGDPNVNIHRLSDSPLRSDQRPTA